MACRDTHTRAHTDTREQQQRQRERSRGAAAMLSHAQACSGSRSKWGGHTSPPAPGSAAGHGTPEHRHTTGQKARQALLSLLPPPPPTSCVVRLPVCCYCTFRSPGGSCGASCRRHAHVLCGAATRGETIGLSFLLRSARKPVCFSNDRQLYAFEAIRHDRALQPPQGATGAA